MATLPVLDADHRNAPLLDDAALADLARRFRGELIRAGDPPYEAARRVWRPRTSPGSASPSGGPRTPTPSG